MIELIKDRVKVKWVDLGEGWCGEYSPDDPDDEELLRFDVFFWEPSEDGWDEYNGKTGNWGDPGDASYCTRFPYNSTLEEQQKGLQIIMANVYDPLMSGYSIKKMCEELSWIGLDWLEEKENESNSL